MAIHLTASVDESLEGIDFDFERGAWIRGSVLSGTNAEWSAQVKVEQKRFDTNTLDWIYESVNDGYTDQQGAYEIVVPEGSNYVVFASEGSEYGVYTLGIGAPGFYYDSAVFPETAALVSAFIDVPAEHVDFDLDHLPMISGTVMADGVPVANAIVEAWQRSTADPFSGSNVVASMSSIGAYTHTDLNGAYFVRVSPGSNFYIRASVESNTPLVPEYYNNSYSAVGAEMIHLSLDEQMTNVNFSLAAGVQIHGVVTDEEGARLSNPSITLYDDAAQYINYAMGSLDGTYSVYAPVGMSVTLAAYSSGARFELFSNAWNFADITFLTGTTGDVLTADFVLFRTDADRDEDGLPDYQEETVPDGIYTPGVDYSDLNTPDTDHDGVNDWAEKMCGTSPLDSSDYLYISDARMTTNGVEFSWTTQNLVRYQVERCTDLSSAEWTPLPGIFDGNGSDVNFLDSSEGFDHAYYRVRVLP